MKYYKKIFIITLILIIGITYATMEIVSKTQRSALKNYNTKRVSIDKLSFELPLLHSPKDEKVYIDKGWIVKRYYWRGIGVFRFSKASGKNLNFKYIAAKYFRIEEFPNSGRKLIFGKRLMFIKEIPLFNNGVYAIRKKGKRIIYTYFFIVGNNLYWLDFNTSSTVDIYKKVFDKILLSIESSDKNLKRALTKEEFKKELSSLCIQSFYLLCQSSKGMVVFVGVFTILIFLLINFILSLGGKLPPNEYFSGEYVIYSEEGINYQIKYGYSNKTLIGAFVITDKNLYIFAFKKPVLKLPKDAKDFFISTGKAFLIGDFIEIKTQNPYYFIRNKNSSTTKEISIKIYLSDIATVSNYLGIKSI